MGGNLPLTEGEHDLDESGHARGRFQVAHVGLDRADQQATRPSRTEHRPERLHLDGIPQRGAGAVSLGVDHLFRSHPGPGERFAKQRHLGGPVGGGQAAARAVLVDRAPPDQGQDAVTVGQGIGEALQDDEAAALAFSEALRRGVEGPASPVGGEHPGLAEGDRVLRRQDEVDAPGQGHAALPGPQGLASQMNGHQRRRAGGVHGQAGTLQAEDVRQTAGGDAVGGPRGPVGVDLGEILSRPQPEGRVVGAGNADVDPGPASREAVRGLARVFQGFPCHLQQQPLLGVHAHRLPGGDAEELGVEAVHSGEKAPVPRVHLAGGVGVGVVKRLDVPAVGGDSCDRVPAPVEEPPESLRALASRKAAAQTDHRDGLGARAFHRPQTGLHLLKGEESALEGGEPAGVAWAVRHLSSPSSLWRSKASASVSVSCASRTAEGEMGASGAGAGLSPSTSRPK